MAKHAHRKAQQRKKNNNLWIWGVVALVIFGLSAVWLTSQGTTGSSSSPREISVAEALAKKDAGVFILDVREPAEWNEFRIASSILIPLGELESRVNELPRDQEIVVVCRTGHRSALGRDTLLNAGFTQVVSMAGGLTEWKAAGYPTVSGP